MKLRALFAAALLAALLVSCTGARQKPTPAPGAAPRLVLVEEHGDSARIVLERPGDATERRVVAAIEHRQGYGVRATVSPDGRLVAYTVLPRDATDPDTQAQLWLLPLDGRKPRRLATGIDLRSDLVWSPGSTWVTYERVPDDPAHVLEVRRVNIVGAGDELLADDTVAARWYAMGYSPDGQQLALARLDADGTVVTLGPAGSVPATGYRFTGMSRAFIVSGRGCPALLVLGEEGGRQVYRAYACDGDGYSRLTRGGLEDTGIAWNPVTNIFAVGVVLGPPGSAPPAAARRDAEVVVPPSGFDVPLAWSPDGRALAVRHFTGATTDAPGEASIAVVLAGGARVVITGDGPLDVAGWTGSA
jgi:hypothetical protein